LPLLLFFAYNITNYGDALCRYGNLIFEACDKAGKGYMEAVIAVANKLLRTIYVMLIHRTYYSPNYS